MGSGATAGGEKVEPPAQSTRHAQGRETWLGRGALRSCLRWGASEKREVKARKSHHRITSVFHMEVMGTQAGALSVTVGRMGQCAVTD